MKMGKKTPTRRTPEELALEEKRKEEFKDKILARKKKLAKRENQRGVVLLSHIPLGFYEPQMYDYFSQFGRVTRLKLLRSKKTGRSRQFAFIEFQFEEVAKVVAQTMNNYLMYQKILKCKLIPLDEVRPNTFKNWRFIKRIPLNRRKEIRKHNEAVTDPSKTTARLKRIRARRAQLNKKLEELGIDYDVKNIKINESFVAPERTRATPEELAEVYARIPDSIGMEDRYSDADESDVERVNNEDDENEVKETTEIDENKEVAELSQKKENQAQSTSTKSSNPIQEEADFGVMVVDLEDPEVTFKSPSAESNIKKKSVGISKVAKRRRKQETVNDESSTCCTPLSTKQLRLLKIEKLRNALNDDKDESNNENTSGDNKKPSPKRKVPQSAKKPKTKKSRKSLNKTM